MSIPQGSGVSTIAQKLKDAGVIRSAYLFRWYVGQKGAASKLQYGDTKLFGFYGIFNGVDRGSDNLEELLIIVSAF